MDIKDKLKDNAWTQNISQKFDDVCKEVDDFVSMDTVKYVENQVQTFGDSFRSFCSNVLQDLLPSTLPNPECHDSETVPDEGDIVAKTYKKSLINLNEDYIDTDTESLYSDLSNSAHQDVESVPEKEKCSTQDHNKSVIKLIEEYVDTASKQRSTECDSIHQALPFSEINSVNRPMPMPMPTEDEKKLTKTICPLVKYECDLVHDDVKSSVVDYIGSEIEEIDIKDESLSQDLSCDGINDESSIVFVTENDYHSHKITDDVVSVAVVDSVGNCSSVEEITYDNHSDECNLKALGNSQSSTVVCSFVPCGCNVAEGPLFSSVSLPSNDSFYQSEFYNTPQAENFVNDHTDSVQCIYDTADVDDISTIDEEVGSNRSSGHTREPHWNPYQTKAPMSVVELEDADKFNINITDPDMETIDLSEKTKRNESCVIVEDKLLVATSSRPRRHRSYKQMIKDACTSTKRLTKEYELLGILYGDIDMESVQHENSSILTSVNGTSPGNKQSPTKDLADSEWEIL